VKQATHLETGEAYALKLVRKTTTPRVLLEHEVRVMSVAGAHRHIASLVDHFESEDAWGLVLKLAVGGEVFDRVCKQGPYTEHSAVVVVRQVAEALRHLHSRGIVHRDLKLENVLLSSREGHADVLLCDFGMARFIGLGAPPLNGRAGTLAYMAPEMLSSGSYGPQVDVWALGVITFILLAGCHPFNPTGTLDEASIELRIKSGQWDFSGECWDRISEEARELITKMLHPDPEQRLKISELLASPWFAGSQASEVCRYSEEQRKWRAAIRALALIGCATPSSSGGPPASEGLAGLDLPACALAELREAFDAYDSNGNGTIELEELLHFTSSLGVPRSAAEYAARRANRSDSGAISFQEFSRIVGPLYGHSQAALRSAFDLFDADGSGEIDKSELSRILVRFPTLNADLDAMFACADTDGDGRISFHEFVALFSE